MSCRSSPSGRPEAFQTFGFNFLCHFLSVFYDDGLNVSLKSIYLRLNLIHPIRNIWIVLFNTENAFVDLKLNLALKYVFEFEKLVRACSIKVRIVGSIIF